MATFECINSFHKAHTTNLAYLPSHIAIERALGLYFVCKGIRPACLWWSDSFPDDFEFTNSLLEELSEQLPLKWENGYCNINAYGFEGEDFPDQPATLIYHPDNLIAARACDNSAFLTNMLDNSLLLGQVLGYPCAGAGAQEGARYHYRFIGFKLIDEEPHLDEPIPVLEMICDDRNPETENLSLQMCTATEEELDLTVQLYLADNLHQQTHHVNPETGLLTLLD